MTRLRVFAGLVISLVSLYLHEPAGSFEQSERTGADQFFIVVSVTQFNADTYDVKLRNPRTGYIHSVTVYVEIVINLQLRVGDRVRERRDNGRVILVRDDGSSGPGGPPPGPGSNPTPNPKSDGPRSGDRRPPNSATPSLPGYQFYPIDTLRIVNAFSEPRDKPLGPSYVSAGTCDVMANGSFTQDGRTPAVPVMRNGTLDSKGVGKSLLPEDVSRYGGQITTDGRGGVAVRGGTIIVGRQQGRGLDEIERAFGPGVTELMGGGAMLIEHHGALRALVTSFMQPLYHR